MALQYTQGRHLNILDWFDDIKQNGVWDDGEGELWLDWGSDWCPDNLENGGGFCIADTMPCNCLLDSSEVFLGYDPNGDNADPNGDDWNPENGIGTENNGIYDWNDDGDAVWEI